MQKATTTALLKTAGSIFAITPPSKAVARQAVARHGRSEAMLLEPTRANARNFPKILLKWVCRQNLTVKQGKQFLPADHTEPDI